MAKFTKACLQVVYAFTMAFAQAIITYAQVRAEQQALADLTAGELKDLVQTPGQAENKAPIGFLQ